MGQRLCGEQLPAAASAERPSLALPVAREKPNTWLGKRFLSKRDEEKKDFKKKGRIQKEPAVGFTGWSHKEMLQHSWECAGCSRAWAQTAEDGAASRQ